MLNATSTVLQGAFSVMKMLAGAGRGIAPGPRAPQMSAEERKAAAAAARESEERRQEEEDERQRAAELADFDNRLKRTAEQERKWDRTY